MTPQNPTPDNTPDPPAAGKGMPAKDPKPQRSLPGQHETPGDSSVKNTLELPNDRDQALDMTDGQNSPVMSSASRMMTMTSTMPANALPPLSSRSFLCFVSEV